MGQLQHVAPVALRDRRRLPPVADKSTDSRQQLTHAGQYILCASCQHLLSSQVSAVNRQGMHEHTRINPVGLQFHFACFSQLDDIHIKGEPSAEHTWFSGYRWQFAVCRSCWQHLGWYFTSAGDSFYGLILDRIQIHSTQ